MSLEETLAFLVAESRQTHQELTKLRAAYETLSNRIPPQLVTVQDAAPILGFSESTIRRRVQDGSIPCKRIGTAIRVNLSAMNDLTPAQLARIAEMVREPS